MEDKLNFYFGLIISMAAFFLVAVGFIIVFMRYQKKTLSNQRMLHELDIKHKKDLITNSITSSETERVRIAKDIHDDIGGIFSALSLSLNQVSRAKDEAAAAAQLEQTKKLIRSGADSVRRISHAIVPFGLELFGLQKAIDNYLDTIASVSNINTSCESNFDLDRLGNDVALSIYRILQELTSNTMKYAEANELKVSFHQDAAAEVIMMHYSDDGKGMDEDVRGKLKGIGLKNIESRAISLDASLSIGSSPGKGVTCTIAIPLKHLPVQ